MVETGCCLTHEEDVVALTSLSEFHEVAAVTVYITLRAGRYSREPLHEAEEGVWMYSPNLHSLICISPRNTL